MGTIVTRALGEMAFEVQLGNHRLLVDVPLKMGGQDRGPTPPELFIASLGSCVAAFIASYSAQHVLNSSGLEVHVDFAKDPGPPVRLKDLVVRVLLPHAELPDEAHAAALRHVAEHCPVHETLQTLDTIRFEFQLGEQGAAEAG